METTKESFTKQYNNNQELCETDENNIVIIDEPSAFTVFTGNQNYNFLRKQNTTIKRKYEEPIDLTNTQRENLIDTSEHHSLMLNYQNHSEIFNILEPYSSINTPKKRGRKRKNFCDKVLQDNSNELSTNNMSVQNLFDFQISKKAESEIMKAAETLFSKRTRTLYNWMYPNLPKQQVKLAVASSWEKLENDERQYYVSEVLVRFGFSKSNLIVNPQIGGIKELPPLPDEMNFTYDVNELQNSSLVASFETTPSLSNSMLPIRRHRLGRPPGSKNKKNLKNDLFYKMSNNFQDDLELSRELEQFDINFNNFK